MALVVPTLSKVDLLRIIANIKNQDDLFLHLFDNNITIDLTTRRKDLSELPTPFEPARLVPENWLFETVSEPPTIFIDGILFNLGFFSGTVYGYFISLGETGPLLWAENFDTPFTVTATSELLRVTPRLTLDD